MKFIKRLWPANPVKPDNFLMAVLSVLLAFGGGCAAPHPSAPPIRVGIAPDYPPLAFARDGQGAGVEVDLARTLGAQLGRPVAFTSLRWEELIPALQRGDIDIIMSGMSITPGRQLVIAFSEPYVTNQLRAIFSRANVDRFKTPGDITNGPVRIGVMPGTTADTFVQKNCPQAERIALNTRPDAAFYLLQNPQIDVYIDDTFALAQILSENEASLTFLRQPLAENNLAWGVRPDNTDLLRQVNAVLARCKSDGTLDKILTRWIPYLKKYESSQQREASGAQAP
jgi:ABC-type amino acid transport substrate-binding protein